MQNFGFSQIWSRVCTMMTYICTMWTPHNNGANACMIEERVISFNFQDWLAIAKPEFIYMYKICT